MSEPRVPRREIGPEEREPDDPGTRPPTPPVPEHDPGTRPPTPPVPEHDPDPSMPPPDRPPAQPEPGDAA